MDNFDKILVPIDFGHLAQVALELAFAVGIRFDSQITLFHAYTLPIGPYLEGMTWPIQEFEIAARRALDVAMVDGRKRYPRLDSTLTFGAPAPSIVEHATNAGCHLIVMGTHGRRGIPRFLLGSVAERVVRTSPVPVLTVSA